MTSQKPYPALSWLMLVAIAGCTAQRPVKSAPAPATPAMPQSTGSRPKLGSVASPGPEPELPKSRLPSKPWAKVVELFFQGPRQPDEADAAVLRSADDAQRCYAKLALDQPELRGRFDYRVMVEPNGALGSEQVDDEISPELTSCVRGALAKVDWQAIRITHKYQLLVVTRWRFEISPPPRPARIEWGLVTLTADEPADDYDSELPRIETSAEDYEPWLRDLKPRIERCLVSATAFRTVLKITPLRGGTVVNAEAPEAADTPELLNCARKVFDQNPRRGLRPATVRVTVVPRD